jgi:type IV secretory pathway VirB2 component (pilin)
VISGAHSSMSGRQQDVTATAMQHTGGRILVGAVGVAIIVCGIVLITEGARKKFMRHLSTAQMSPRTRRVVRLLGMTGTIARGVVFALVGVLVTEAAVTHKASDSGGIDKALLTLRQQPFGEFLMLLAALGLLIFGIYGLCEARWRKV